MIVVETERLILRTWTKEDIDPYYCINQDYKVVEFLLKTSSIDQVEKFISNMNHQFHALGYTLFAAEEKLSGKLMGFIGLNVPKWTSHFTPCVEIGWRLGSDHWGKGYATEGAKAILDYGFKNGALNEIIALTVPDNLRSLRVMDKIGMDRDINGDFIHPMVPLGHMLSQHVLYRIRQENFDLQSL